MSREWYPWFPHRFWTSERVALMDDAAVGLYKFLLDHEWENGPFSSDERVLRALCARFRNFESSWPQVLPCFEKNAQGRYFNERMEHERELERQASHARAERSKNSWTKRRDAADSVRNGSRVRKKSTRNARAEHADCSQPATDGRTDGPTDGRTDLPTDGGAGGPAPTARARARPPLEELVRGTVLDTPLFLEAFRAWEGFHGAYKPKSIGTQLGRLAGWGEARAIAALRYSLAQEYEGIHEERNGNAGHNGTAKRGGRRADGTREGEYAEPDVAPARV